MFDTVVENTAKRIAAELAASLISIEDLAKIAEDVREIVHAHALMPLSPEYTLGLTLAGGKIRVGQVTDEVNPETGEDDPMGVFSFRVYRGVAVEADHLDRDLLSDVISEFDDEPEEPAKAVFGSDLLVYAILHELTGAGFTTLARVYATEQELEMDSTAFREPFPPQVMFLAEEALLYHKQNFSSDARADRYGSRDE